MICAICGCQTYDYEDGSIACNDCLLMFLDYSESEETEEIN